MTKIKKNILLQNLPSESFYIEDKINSIITKKKNNIKFLDKDSSGLKKKPYLLYIESVLQKQIINNTTFQYYGIVESLKTASSIGTLIAKKLENKIRFSKIKRELFEQVQQSNFIEGIRISCSGSLKGGLMAKTYIYKLGATSLQIFSKKIDYHFCYALTKYGSLGIKVWVAYK